MFDLLEFLQARASIKIWAIFVYSQMSRAERSLSSILNPFELWQVSYTVEWDKQKYQSGFIPRRYAYKFSPVTKASLPLIVLD